MPDDQKKKICCVSVMQNWGGGELFLQELSKNLRDFDFVIISPEGKVKKRFDEAGLKTRVNNYQRKIYRSERWGFVSFIRISLNILFSFFRLWKIFSEEKPDLILANGLFAALYVLPVVKLSRRKFIIVQHLIFNEKSIEQKIIKLVYGNSIKVVCVSQAVKDNLIKLLAEDKDQKLVVINNGVEAPTRPVPDQSVHDKIQIGLVGSIIRIKGIHIIIEAVREILKAGRAELVIYGTTTEAQDSAIYQAELKELIKKYEIGSHVTFKGHQESKETIYSGIDIFVNYSTIPEAFPYSVLEAMAHGKVVIAAASGGPKEMIEDGISGFLVEPEDAAKLRMQIEYCIKNIGEESLKLIRKNAVERIKNQFSIEKFAENYRSLFYKLSGGSGQRMDA